MSPEQAQGKPLTPASDIYSLAVILYEVLTGKLPFDATNAMEYIQLHVTARPIPIGERVAGKRFPPLLWAVLDKALSKRAEERHATGGELAHALGAVLSGLSEVPPYANRQAVRAPMLGGGAVPSPNVAQAAKKASPETTLMPRSSPLPKLESAAGKQPSVGLLVGVAIAFLVVGAALAALVMKLVMK
jgi:serine/threonine-protein kinase